MEVAVEEVDRTAAGPLHGFQDRGAVRPLDALEPSWYADALGHVPRPLIPRAERRDACAGAGDDGQLARRSVEALTRQGDLAGRPETWPGLGGLEMNGGSWDLVEGSRASDVSGFAIGPIVEGRPDLSEHAMIRHIREKGWIIADRVIHILDRGHGREG